MSQVQVFKGVRPGVFSLVKSVPANQVGLAVSNVTRSGNKVLVLDQATGKPYKAQKKVKA